MLRDSDMPKSLPIPKWLQDLRTIQPANGKRREGRRKLSHFKRLMGPIQRKSLKRLIYQLRPLNVFSPRKTMNIQKLHDSIQQSKKMLDDPVYLRLICCQLEIKRLESIIRDLMKTKES